MTIVVKSGNPHQVRISASVAGKVSSSDRVVLYGAAVSSNPNPLSLTWSCSGQPAAFNNQLFGSSLTAPTAVLRRGMLAPGATYVFRFTAVDVDGGSATAEVTVVVNAPPSSGYIVPEPVSGTALTTSFSFTAAQWVDDAEDLPLSYVFAYVVGNVTNLSDVSEDQVRGSRPTLARCGRCRWALVCPMLPCVCCTCCRMFV